MNNVEMDLATALAVVEALSVGVTMTEAERDHYREALESILKVDYLTEDAWVIARAALDGEG